jgi:hypothetical protein
MGLTSMIYPSTAWPADAARPKGSREIVERACHARRLRDQPAGQPGGDDRLGSGVAGQDLEGSA